MNRPGDSELRGSGYVSRFQELWYGVATPVYDVMVRIWMVPIGGERACREWIVRCVDARDGHEVLSLCCGTGTTDRVLHEMVPGARITAIDLGAGQIATAQRSRQLPSQGPAPLGAVRRTPTAREVFSAPHVALDGGYLDAVRVGAADELADRCRAMLWRLARTRSGQNTTHRCAPAPHPSCPCPCPCPCPRPCP